jgi:predicted transcriptional regulator
MKTIQDINSAIMSGTWTDAELSSIIDAVRFNRAQLARRVKGSIVLGDQVKFYSAKRSMTVAGTVKKVAIKYVTVQTSQGGLWKVPANMLEVI